MTRDQATPKSRSNELQSDQLSTQIQRQFGMLIAQFLLGMAVNLIGNPSTLTSTFSKATFDILLLLHVLIAIGLLANALFIIRLAMTKGANPKSKAQMAASAIGLAIIFGGLTLTPLLSNLWSFFMAVSFITALVTYGNLYSTTRTSS